MDYVSCKECGGEATVFDDGNPFCQECYDKMVRDYMRKNGILTGCVKYINQADADEAEYHPKMLQPFNVPYAVQRRLLYATFDETVEWMREMLKDNEFLDEVEEMAAKRLAEGYEKYGSKMYSWDSETRDRNILEELADAFVYKSSGDV